MSKSIDQVELAENNRELRAALHRSQQKVKIELIISSFFLIYFLDLTFEFRNMGPAYVYAAVLAINSLTWLYWITCQALLAVGKYREPLSDELDDPWREQRIFQHHLSQQHRRELLINMSVGVQFAITSLLFAMSIFNLG